MTVLRLFRDKYRDLEESRAQELRLRGGTGGDVPRSGRGRHGGEWAGIMSWLKEELGVVQIFCGFYLKR